MELKVGDFIDARGMHRSQYKAIAIRMMNLGCKKDYSQPQRDFMFVDNDFCLDAADVAKGGKRDITKEIAKAEGQS